MSNTDTYTDAPNLKKLGTNQKRILDLIVKHNYVIVLFTFYPGMGHSLMLKSKDQKEEIELIPYKHWEGFLDRNLFSYKTTNPSIRVEKTVFTLNESVINLLCQNLTPKR